MNLYFMYMYLCVYIVCMCSYVYIYVFTYVCSYVLFPYVFNIYANYSFCENHLFYMQGNPLLCKVHLYAKSL